MVTCWLSSDRFTEADLRLYPTLIRFDAVYATLFKCCRRRLKDYPKLSAWTRDVYQLQLGSEPHLQVCWQSCRGMCLVQKGLMPSNYLHCKDCQRCCLSCRSVCGTEHLSSFGIDLDPALNCQPPPPN